MLSTRSWSVFPSWTSPVRLLTHVGTADLARSIPAEPPLPTNKTPAAGGRESRGSEMKAQIEPLMETDCR
jgi:hypothetical protein